jgi:hypothetical protein
MGSSARRTSRRVVAALRSRPTLRSHPQDLRQPATRRVSLAEGSAPLVHRRGTELAGCRCAPKPPYDSKPSAGSEAIHDPQAVTRRRQCTIGSPARYRAGGLSLRYERPASRAALPAGSAPSIIGTTHIRRAVASLRAERRAGNVASCRECLEAMRRRSMFSPPPRPDGTVT